LMGKYRKGLKVTTVEGQPYKGGGVPLSRAGRQGIGSHVFI